MEQQPAPPFRPHLTLGSQVPRLPHLLRTEAKSSPWPCHLRCSLRPSTRPPGAPGAASQAHPRAFARLPSPGGTRPPSPASPRVWAHASLLSEAALPVLFHTTPRLTPQRFTASIFRFSVSQVWHVRSLAKAGRSPAFPCPVLCSCSRSPFVTLIPLSS